MAFLHRAWHFEPMVAHRAIAKAVVRGDRISLAQLSEEARMTVLEGADEFLRMIRFDLSWLEEDLEPAHLYVVALGRHLRPAASIQHPGILLWLLQEIGWSEALASELIHGDSMTTLLAGLSDPLIDLIRPDLGQFGGLLSPSRCEHLLRELRMVEHHFVAIEEKRLRSIATSFHLTDQLARRALRDMYESATALMEHSLQLRLESAVLCISP